MKPFTLTVDVMTRYKFNVIRESCTDAERLTMSEAEDYIDWDNPVSHFLVNVFCESDDSAPMVYGEDN